MPNTTITVERGGKAVGMLKVRKGDVVTIKLANGTSWAVFLDQDAPGVCREPIPKLAIKENDE